ncbi:MAG: hypothetical protein EOO65_05045, partial [Methanosarcinales archaeon]
MHRACFHGEVAEDAVQANFALVGGIPRWIFNKSNDDARQAMLDALTKISDIERMMRMLGYANLDSDENQSHRLIHLLPCGVCTQRTGATWDDWRVADRGHDDDTPTTVLTPDNASFYKPCLTVLASRWVAAQVHQQLAVASAERLRAVLAQPPTPGPMARVYGELLEPAALAVLEKGGDFACFAVGQEGSELTLNLPGRRVQYFSNLTKLSQMFTRDSTQLLVPCSESFTAIDVVLPGGLMANVTIDTQHDLKLYGAGSRSREGVLPVAAALGMRDGKIPFYWIVPQDTYDKLKRSRKTATQFRITIPEESAALAREVELQKAVENAVAGGELWKIRAALTSYRADMAEKKAEWSNMRARVQQYVLCISFRAPSPPAELHDTAPSMSSSAPLLTAGVGFGAGAAAAAAPAPNPTPAVNSGAEDDIDGAVSWSSAGG